MEWLKKIGTNIKIAFGFIAGILGFFLFFFIREKLRAKDKMRYELKKLESELKITELEKDSDEKRSKISNLKKQESLIREKIQMLEEIEAKEGREVSLEELDKFFDDRGF